MEIYDIIRSEYLNVGLVEIPYAIERFSASYGCHLLNLVNTSQRKFYTKSKLTNFRRHVVIQAPSGFSKSLIMDFFLHPETGLLSKVWIPTDVESTFTKESWMGSIVSTDDEGNEIATDGVFQRFKNGIVGADEYSTLKDMAENPGERNDVVYLLKALDDGRSSKNMAYGRIDITDICMTFWCGMRPTPLRFTSGLGRRFTYQTFFPTRSIAKMFKIANAKKVGKEAIRDSSKTRIANLTDHFTEEAKDVSEIDCSDVDEWLLANDNIPHFDMPHYRGLAIGLAIVRGGFPEIKIDDLVENLFLDEYNARKTIRNNPLHEAVMSVIRDEEGGFPREDLIDFMENYYQIPRSETRAVLNSLKMQGLIETVGGSYYPTSSGASHEHGTHSLVEEWVGMTDI